MVEKKETTQGWNTNISCVKNAARQMYVRRINVNRSINSICWFCEWLVCSSWGYRRSN